MISQPPLLLLDTCLLLDIIRAPVRENVGVHDIRAILTLVARQSANPQTLVFAVSQQVRDEYADNVDSVEEETRRGIERLLKQTNEMLATVATFNSGIAIPAPLQLEKEDVVSVVRAMADEILINCVTIPHTVDDSHAAMGRVQRAHPPATRAKQSIKDCLIVEGVLRHVAAERANGNVEKAVFASSNTSDYHQGHASLHPVLRTEFDGCGLGFAPSWSAARYEIDRP